MNLYGNYRKKSCKCMILVDSKIYIPIILCYFVLFLISSNLFSISYAIETPVTRQSIRDAPFDWVNIDNQTAATEGDPATDISEVTYFTNGKTLNSTIWLLFPFKELPVGYSIFNYGMLIDSDFDEDTGAGGIDYQLEIRWNNETNTWTRVLTEWSSTAVGGRILEESKNFTRFSGDQLFYVSIPIELGDISNPNKFRTVYYAESKRGASPLVTDFTKWINVPPQELQLATYPQSIELRQGESKTVELTINSTSGLEPDVILYSENQDTDPVLDFSAKKLKIPSNGFASIPLTVSTSGNTKIAPHTIFIFANSSYPAFEFVKVNATSHDIEFPFKIQGDDKMVKTSLLIDVKEPLSLTDKISEFWNKLGELLLFLYGVVAGLSPMIFNAIRKKLTKSTK
jgi:hypothetical protein